MCIFMACSEMWEDDAFRQVSQWRGELHPFFLSSLSLAALFYGKEQNLVQKAAVTKPFDLPFSREKEWRKDEDLQRERGTKMWIANTAREVISFPLFLPSILPVSSEGTVGCGEGSGEVCWNGARWGGGNWRLLVVQVLLLKKQWPQVTLLSSGSFTEPVHECRS